jgi:uncharacterized protein (TIRG00374 family)
MSAGAGTALARRRGARVVRVAILMAVVVAATVAVTRLDIARLAASMGAARWHWIGLAALCYVATLPMWAIAWQVLLGPAAPPFRTMLGITSVTSAVYALAVAFGGEVAAVALLVTRARLGRAQAVGLVLMDQVLQGAAKCATIFAAALTMPLPPWARAGAAALVLGVGLGTVLLAVAVVGTKGSSPRPRRLIPNAVRQLGEALATFRSPSRATAALGLAIAKQAAEIIAVLCVQRAFDIHLPFGSAILVVAALGLSTLIPATPGNLGVFEGTIVAVYAGFGVRPEDATAMAITQHAVYLIAFTLPGGILTMRGAASGAPGVNSGVAT